MSRSILVVGATGRQGSAVVKSLLDTDFQILALVRNPATPSALQLAQYSHKIQLLQGDLKNAPAVFRTAQQIAKTPIWGVYAMHPAGAAPTVEATQAKALIDAAIAHNVQFLVYSSIDRGGDRSSSNPTPIPSWAAKHDVEKHLERVAIGTAMRYAVLRPVAFMEELTASFEGKAMAKMWAVALKDKPLQLVATRDIGWFAARAFVHPEEFAGRCLSLAGDELTFREADEAFRATFGKGMPGTFVVIAQALLHLMKDIGAMFKWFREEGNGADVKELRRIYPNLMDFRTWLVRESPFRAK